MEAKFTSFKDFYPFYLQQHQNAVCRRLHFIGIFLSFAVFFYVLFTAETKGYAFLSILIGYAFGWVGHFFFEKNKPATFKHPLYSFRGDFTMAKDILIGRVKF